MKKTLLAVVALTLSWGACLAVSTHARAGDELPRTPAKPAPAKPGKVKLSHEARKVLSCEKVMDEGEAVCRPATREPAKSGAKVKLNPIEGEGAEPGQARSPQSVELDDKVGEQSRVLTIEVGNWEMVWQGAATMRDKFFVKAGDEFDIALQTDIGVCRLKGAECALDKDKKQQSVEIPTERGL